MRNSVCTLKSFSNAYCSYALLCSLLLLLLWLGGSCCPLKLRLEYTDTQQAIHRTTPIHYSLFLFSRATPNWVATPLKFLWTLLMPQFVNPKKTKLGLCVFAVRTLIRVYFCLFMFCFLYSLQHFWLCFLVCLAQAHALSHSHTYTCFLSVSLSLITVGQRGFLALSDVPTLQPSTHTAIVTTNGFHFHCAAYSPTHTDSLSHTHKPSCSLSRFSYYSLSVLCSVLFCALSVMFGSALSLQAFCDFQFQSEKVLRMQRSRI